MKPSDRVRKRDREVSDRERLLDALDHCDYGFLAMADGGRPYLIPISYVRNGNVLYFHCARVGKKIDFITASPRVAFCVTPIAKYMPGALDFEYFSVYVEGLARIVQDKQEKYEAYRLLISKYEKGKNHELKDACVDTSNIISIDICMISGKENTPHTSIHETLL